MKFEADDFDDLLKPADDFDTLLVASLQPSLESMATLPQWVAWREVQKDGKWRKVPFDPASPRRGAKANDRTTWGTRTAALKAVAQMPSDDGKRGVGLQLGLFDDAAHLRIAGIDLDSCLDPATGDVEPWAAEVINRFASYAEVSPGGEGVKVFFTYAVSDAAALIEAMRHPETGKERHRLAWSRGTHCEIGLDVSHRYYCVTGNRWGDCPSTFRPASLSDLLWLITEAGPAFLSGGTSDEISTKSVRDESGSGCAYRAMLSLAADGHEKTAALKILRAASPSETGDTGKAAEWLTRTTAREIDRTWANAKAAADERRRVSTSADEFDDVDDLDSEASVADDPVTARLNRRHAVVVVKGRTLITTERKDGTVDFGQVRDLHAYYENDRVSAGEGKKEPASRRWMRNSERRQYPDGVTFAPGGCPVGTLNLWRGWAVEPDPTASCDLFLQHVRKVICGGNVEHTAYVLGWLAHMVQRPGEKPGVGIVLKGSKGAGKDSVADYVARMIGTRHAPTVAESDHVTGKFNARLETALLLHVQEGTWAGDRKAEGTLKYLVTSDRVEIERKGIDSINLPSVLRLFISANADWVVPASADERRWAVFEVSGARRRDETYFNALRQEMTGSGPAALLHFLQSYDLTGFNVRAAPETEGLLNQKIASLKNIDLWWFEILNKGSSPTGWEESDWGGGQTAAEWESALTVSRDALRGRYVEWMKTRRFDGSPVEERYFGRRLRDLLPALEDRRPRTKGVASRSRQYVIPALSECRAAFDAWIGSPVDWDTTDA